mgnify:CR=1 FL=1
MDNPINTVKVIFYIAMTILVIGGITIFGFGIYGILKEIEKD